MCNCNDPSTDDSQAHNKISRRTALKVLGTAALAPAAIQLPVHDHSAVKDAATQPEAPNNKTDASGYDPIFESPLYQETLKRMALLDIQIDKPSLSTIFEDQTGVALRVNGITTSNPRVKADLICVADAKERALLSTQFIISTSLESTLEIYSAVLTDESLVSETISGRPPITINGPSQQLMWSFSREEKDVLPPPVELPMYGFPPDDSKTPYWLCSSFGSAATWERYNDKPTLRWISASEVLSDDSTRTRTVEIKIIPKPQPQAA
jgi:hypothetical protein